MDEVTEILKNLDWSPLYISYRNIEKSGLEPSVYFFENRCGSYGDFVFSRDICGWKSSKSFPGEKSGARWDFDASYGDASYGSRLFFTVVV